MVEIPANHVNDSVSWIHCNWGIPDLHLDQPIKKGWCQPVGGHASWQSCSNQVGDVYQSRIRKVMKEESLLWQWDSQLDDLFVFSVSELIPCLDWFFVKTNTKMSYQYRKSHCGDKTVGRSSYLHNGISYTRKMESLYWIRLLVIYIQRKLDLRQKNPPECLPEVWRGKSVSLMNGSVKRNMLFKLWSGTLLIENYLWQTGGSGRRLQNFHMLCNYGDEKWGGNEIRSSLVMKL